MAKKPTKKRMVKKQESPKNCYFCSEKKEPTYMDPTSLAKFITERGKIFSRSRSGLCAMHQRHLTLAVKHARHLALLPFSPRV